jgi:hypothetical protein
MPIIPRAYRPCKRNEMHITPTNREHCGLEEGDLSVAQRLEIHPAHRLGKN